MSTQMEEQVASEQAEHDDEERKDRGARSEGKSLEDQAKDAVNGDDDADDEGPQLIIPGTGGARLSNTVGGKKPTDSKFKIRSISLPIHGGVQMEKDETVWVAVECAIDKVEHENHRDGRVIVGVTRTHIAYPLGAPIILDGPPEGAEPDES